MQTNGIDGFPVSYDRTAKVLTAGVVLVLAIAAMLTRNWMVVGLGAAIIALSYAYSPRAYAISARSITVRRLIGDLQVPLGSVKELRSATEEDLRGCLRLWGSGGLFGYYGWFRTSKLGNCRWYVTNRSNAVVLTTNDRTFLFSPDDRDRFLNMLRSSASIVPLPTAGAVKQGSRAGMRIGIAAGVVAVLVAALAILYAPGPPAFTLTRDSLVIHDRFYPVTLKAADVEVTQVRAVDLREQPEWRPVARTNGFSNRHYHSGWFRLGDGRKIRLYRADGQRLILLPPKAQGVPVLLEVREPQEFLAAVKQTWSSLP